MKPKLNSLKEKEKCEKEHKYIIEYIYNWENNFRFLGIFYIEQVVLEPDEQKRLIMS